MYVILSCIFILTIFINLYSEARISSFLADIQKDHPFEVTQNQTDYDIRNITLYLSSIKEIPPPVKDISEDIRRVNDFLNAKKQFPEGKSTGL